MDVRAPPPEAPTAGRAVSCRSRTSRRAASGLPDAHGAVGKIDRGEENPRSETARAAPWEPADLKLLLDATNVADQRDPPRILQGRCPRWRSISSGAARRQRKGRVSTSDVFGVKDSDLVPGKYEGGLKLWEGSLDLVKALNSDIKEGRLFLEGKRVLELGCGHGLPGIFAGLKGAGLIHFQDFNAEVLKCLTIPNVKVNLFKESPEGTCTSRSVGFFAGDWGEMDKLLLCGDADQDKTTTGGTEDKTYNGYDIILMAETVYALSSLPNLYKIIKKCLHYPGGVVYMAGKKHYFGVGGGTRQFLPLVEEDGAMQLERLNDVADGSSNVREVWKFSFK